MIEDTVDIKMLNYLDFDNGFYIECGANDGITQSNTYKLEKDKNWKGLLIEPSQFAYQKCVNNRSKDNIILNLALVSEKYDGEFIKGDFVDGDLRSSVNGLRRNNKNLVDVKTRTLTSVLDQYNIQKIDFFSLDVEGYELEVLRGINFDKYSPTYILIEVYEKDKQNILNYMSNNNYEFICNLSGFNHKDYPYWDGTHNDYLFKIIN